MDAIGVLKTRRSVRAYLAKPVPRHILEDLIDCGRLAASANNFQPWEFVVVTGAATLAWLGQTANHGPFIADAAACIAVLCRDTKYYLEDGSAATQNILLAACAHGLGACWVAGDKKLYAPAVSQKLGAPEGCRLISLIALGYPAENPQKAKRPLSQVLHWEKF
jgi:nitroreductase